MSWRYIWDSISFLGKLSAIRLICEMNWIAWLLLNIVLSMVGKLSNARSATCNSEDQCCLEQSTLGKALIGFTYRTLEKKIPLECYQTCDADSICQSINYDMFKERCELNNRTRDARPGHFFKDNHRFYVKRIKNRGTVKSHRYNC